MPTTHIYPAFSFTFSIPPLTRIRDLCIVQPPARDYGSIPLLPRAAVYPRWHQRPRNRSNNDFLYRTLVVTWIDQIRLTVWKSSSKRYYSDAPPWVAHALLSKTSSGPISSTLNHRQVRSKTLRQPSQTRAARVLKNRTTERLTKIQNRLCQ
jgi:hypothetical protein